MGKRKDRIPGLLTVEWEGEWEWEWGGDRVKSEEERLCELLKKTCPFYPYSILGGIPSYLLHSLRLVKKG